MKVAITGASGLIGTALTEALVQGGNQIVAVGRSKPKTPHSPDVEYCIWNVTEGTIEAEKLEGCDSVIHLAGENVASGLWTNAKRKRIRDSRVLGTRLLVDTLRSLKKSPSTLISSSAVGFYGHRPDELLDEKSEPGSGFLVDVCQEWEAEALKAEEFGTRVCLLRTGIVLTPKGGALATMKLPFSLGLGGPLGSGTQRMSWISLEDIVSLYLHCLQDTDISGPVNGVSPEPVTNNEFTKTLGRVLSRYTVFRVPAFVLRALLGEFAEECLLADTAVVPKVATDSGFNFSDTDLEATLKSLLF